MKDHSTRFHRKEKEKEKHHNQANWNYYCSFIDSYIRGKQMTE